MANIFDKSEKKFKEISNKIEKTNIHKKIQGFFSKKLGKQVEIPKE